MIEQFFGMINELIETYTNKNIWFVILSLVFTGWASMIIGDSEDRKFGLSETFYGYFFLISIIVPLLLILGSETSSYLAEEFNSFVKGEIYVPLSFLNLFGSGSVWDQFGISLEWVWAQFRDQFGVRLGQAWYELEVSLASVWDQLVSVWCRFELGLG